MNLASASQFPPLLRKCSFLNVSRLRIESQQRLLFFDLPWFRVNRCGRSANEAEEKNACGDQLEKDDCGSYHQKDPEGDSGIFELGVRANAGVATSVMSTPRIPIQRIFLKHISFPLSYLNSEARCIASILLLHNRAKRR